MSNDTAGRRGWLAPTLVLTLLAGVLTALLVSAGAPPDGPLTPVWDKDVCAFCRMHVGEPAFAAQLLGSDGRTRYFDDPGCLFLYREDRPTERPRAVYFRHVREDRWLRESEVGFEPAAPTPMSFGLGAVDRSRSTIDLAQARQRVLARARPVEVAPDAGAR